VEDTAVAVDTEAEVVASEVVSEAVEAVASEEVAMVVPEEVAMLAPEEMEIVASEDVEIVASEDVAMVASEDVAEVASEEVAISDLIEEEDVELIDEEVMEMKDLLHHTTINTTKVIKAKAIMEHQVKDMMQAFQLISSPHKKCLKLQRFFFLKNTKDTAREFFLFLLESVQMSEL